MRKASHLIWSHERYGIGLVAGAESCDTSHFVTLATSAHPTPVWSSTRFIAHATNGECVPASSSAVVHSGMPTIEPVMAWILHGFLNWHKEACVIASEGALPTALSVSNTTFTSSPSLICTNGASGVRSRMLVLRHLTRLFPVRVL